MQILKKLRVEELCVHLSFFDISDVSLSLSLSLPASASA
jgi:hypothetical protein